MSTIFLCQDSLDGILCGVYDAWTSRLGHKLVRVQIETCGNVELFTEYRYVETEEKKLEQVISEIRNKISEEVFELVFQASLSFEEDRADRIYRFLILGFHFGGGVVNMLQLPEVFEIFRMSRSVGNEAHHLTGFTRFSQVEQGILVGKIRPKNDALYLLATHFADRLSGENWILSDIGRRKAAVHQAGKGWVMAMLNSAQWESNLVQHSDEAEYSRLWSAFHKHIAIKERMNPLLERGNLPLRFRSYMAEFQDKD